MRPLRLSAFALALVLGGASAHADVVAPPSRARRALPPPTLRLQTVSLTAAQAPDGDQARAVADVRRALRAGDRRLRQCSRGLIQRDDPLRQRGRSVVAELAFDRSARPTESRVVRADGVPAAAQGCVRELLSSIRLTAAPRGSVRVRVVYAVAERGGR